MGPVIEVRQLRKRYGDTAARRDTWELIEGMRDRGLTIVLVTHFMEEAERLCDGVALIDSGRVVAIDTPAALAEGVETEQRTGGSWPTALQLLTMAGWAVAFGLAAARFFRWQ